MTSGRQMSLAETSMYPLFLSSRQTAMRKIVQAGFAEAGLTVNTVAEIDTLRTMVDIVELGYAHTILPAPALQRQLKGDGGGLVLTQLDISRTIVLCTSEHLPLGPSGMAVYDLLVDFVQREIGRDRWFGITAPVNQVPV